MPPTADKTVKAPVPEDKRSIPPSKSVEDKLSALRSYCRAKGLCDRCAEKWHRGHTCAATVQLQAMQEVWELFNVEDLEVPMVTAGESEEQLFLAISHEAVNGGQAKRSMQLQGKMKELDIQILIDSGSTNSFVSQRVVDQIGELQCVGTHVQVKVANGGVMQCSSLVPAAEWSIQGYSFCQELKVLPLQSYDIILGMDWLESFSPMKVHWLHKWMAIPYKGSTIILQGMLPAHEEELLIQICSVSSKFGVYGDSELPPEISDLLVDFEVVFSSPSSLPPVRSCDHVIPLVAGARPFNVRPYRYPPSLKDEIEAQVADMLRLGIIRPSSSPFCSPVLLVRKKDGSYRFCVDYRYLNALTVKSKFPIPVFDQLMDELAGASWFTTLDLISGYHQVRLKAGEEYKTAFQTHHGQFEFLVMAFGLSGAPGTFQGAMNCTLAPLLRKCVIVFFDDILIYSKSWEEHLVHLREVLQLLQQDKWHVKLSKCKFAQRKIAYLGHVISEAGVSTDMSKVEAIINWPAPVNVKELRSFLGLAGYYRKFVKHFAIIAKPLTELLKKGVLFVWTQDHETAFDTLKAAMSSAPVLSLPDFSKQFCIETDACKNGVGAVLLQDGHPLAFISKPLGQRTQGLSTYEKEYLAILIAVEQWRSYLLHGEFVIFTDQKSLIHLNEQRLNTPWQQKVFTKLLGMQYRIVYKQGSENRVADALSRRAHETAQLFSLSVATPHWSLAVQEGYLDDTEASELLTKLALNGAAVPNFSLKDGLLRFKGRVWLGNNVKLRQSVLQAMHSSALGGHSGVPVTYQRLKRLFAWRGMKKDVHSFVTSCAICQQAKPERVKYPGLLQPLAVPDGAWQVISMDFVEGLPQSGGKNCVLVVVDKFSKFAHFIPLKHPFTASSVASVFMQEVYRLHGMPKVIISDRDRVFTNQLWKALFALAQVQLSMSSSYHPQSDGQTERVNQCMETFLRCFVHACPSKWVDWIYLAEYWYNTSWHSALGFSPFEVLYGYAPRHFGLDTSVACPVPSLSDWIQERTTMTMLVQQHLNRAQQRMKSQADKNRTERSFAVGESVYLKLQPYVQSSLAPRANQKLAFRFFGPFPIVAKIGSVAYKLLLPASSMVHPVFHVSQLKKVVPSSAVISSLPSDWSGLQVPEKILQRRLSSSGLDGVSQVLVK
ncbi:unnamed protein product [Urochloa humidicola]